MAFFFFFTRVAVAKRHLTGGDFLDNQRQFGDFFSPFGIVKWFIFEIRILYLILEQIYSPAVEISVDFVDQLTLGSLLPQLPTHAHCKY